MSCHNLKVLIFVKCYGGDVTTKKIPIDINIGSKLKDLKDIVCYLHPQRIIKRVLFAGKILREDDKLLTDYGIYKECAIQIMLKKVSHNVCQDDTKHDINEMKVVETDNLIDLSVEQSLKSILNLINEKKIDLNKVDNINRITFILRAKQIISKSHPASTTLHLNGLRATEKEIYQFISNNIPNSIKAMHYNLDDESKDMNQVKIQFKSTAKAIQVLLHLAMSTNDRFACCISFGSNLKYEEIDSKEIENRTLNDDNKWCKMQCYLSKKSLPLCCVYSPEGHDWFAGTSMIVKYIESYLEKNKLDMISTRFTCADLSDLLSKELFETYSIKSLESLIRNKSSYVQCPSCSALIEVIPPTKVISIEEQNRINKLKHTIDGSQISDNVTLVTHWRENRIRCRNEGCYQDFCKICLHQPYHCGDTCESLQDPRCRFCKRKLTEDNKTHNPSSKAFVNVCNKPECMQKMSNSSDKILSCGHISYGIKQENNGQLTIYGYIRCNFNDLLPLDLMRLCILFYEISFALPCLMKNCKSRPDNFKVARRDLCICCYQALSDEPCIILSCNHVFHYECVERRLQQGSTKWYMNDHQYSYCPTCRSPIKHHALKHIIDPIRDCEAQIAKMALQVLKLKGRDDDDQITDVNGRYYNKPEQYGLHLYSFYKCYQCKRPYWSGGARCDDDLYEEEEDPKDFICGRCVGKKGCYKHDILVPTMFYRRINKCRYCCKKSDHNFKNGSKLCGSCQSSSKPVFEFMDNGEIKNLKEIEEYSQCDSVKDKIDSLMKNEKWNKWSRKQKDSELYKIRGNKDLCALQIEHCPNGFDCQNECPLCIGN